MTKQSAEWQFLETRGELSAWLVGDISELLTPEPLFSKAVAAGQVTLDLSRVNRISSAGVREWISLLKNLQAAGVRVRLVNLAVVVVSQLNMISNFAAGASVGSVQAPFFCEACDRHETKLFLVDPTLEAAVAATYPCSGCGKRLEFDDLPERFLAFLRRDEARQ